MKYSFKYNTIVRYCNHLQQPNNPIAVPIFILGLLANNDYKLKDFREDLKEFMEHENQEQ